MKDTREQNKRDISEDSHRLDGVHGNTPDEIMALLRGLPLSLPLP